ncbi:MAG TPA: acyltransferase, partial [Candidatus Sulfotelmatobacter sp.]|nr:acyltransferase [Candidatus Sulfotelmatobacter sp.]
MRDRIPALDGVRAIAILMVIFDHLVNALSQRQHFEIPGWSLLGQPGVIIFFILSGYLITSRLKAEYESTGAIDLKRFYVRRFFRLMPAAWAFLALIWICHPSLSVREIQSAVLFYRNYYRGNVLTAHFWSLSIEEQFYLVWPCVLMLAGFKRAQWVALAGIAGIGLWRSTHLEHFSIVGHGYWTQYRADALFVGCWLGLRGVPSFGRFGEFAAQVLSWRPLVWIGGLSYSLYLWQEAFAFSVTDVWSVIPAVVSMFLMASISHYLIEKPMITFGKNV